MFWDIWHVYRQPSRINILKPYIESDSTVCTFINVVSSDPTPIETYSEQFGPTVIPRTIENILNNLDFKLSGS